MADELTRAARQERHLTLQALERRVAALERRTTDSAAVMIGTRLCKIADRLGSKVLTDVQRVQLHYEIDQIGKQLTGEDE